VAAFAGVLFILLIFILLRPHLVFTPGVPIRLPEQEDLPGVIGRGRTIVVAVDASGQFYFDNQLIHERLLRQRLIEEVNAAREPVTLVIEADESVTWNTLQKLGGIARKAGVKDAVGATRPPLSNTRNKPSSVER
jgi:biopolymer transport protein ExbD